MPVDYIRHSQSTFDAGLTDPGLQEKDAPLTNAGLHQAGTLTGKYDVIICSPLMCARQTVVFSHIAAERTEFTENVREVLDGNVALLLANEATTGADGKPSVETPEHVDARIAKLNARIDQLRSLGKNAILIVSHHKFLQRLLGVSLPPGAGITTLP